MRECFYYQTCLKADEAESVKQQSVQKLFFGLNEQQAQWCVWPERSSGCCGLTCWLQVIYQSILPLEFTHMNADTLLERMLLRDSLLDWETVSGSQGSFCFLHHVCVFVCVGGSLSGVSPHHLSTLWESWWRRCQVRHESSVRSLTHTHIKHSHETAWLVFTST